MQNKKKLSMPRLMLVCLVVVAVGVSYFYRDNIVVVSKIEKTKKTEKTAAESNPWFAPYVDATLTPQYEFEKIDGNVVLSFVVAKNKNSAVPSWGGAYSLDQASDDLDIDRRIARLRQKGGEVIVSFGGLSNSELAITTTDVGKIKNAYAKVVKRYDLNTIDVDLEEEGLRNKHAAKLRGEALAKLQQERKKDKKELAIWVTLPVTPQGLTEDGTDAVTTLLRAGVDLAGVNIMTMDYGGSRNSELSMADNSINALKKTHRQLKIIYQKQGVNLSDKALWRKLGATPMIGQNDIQGEVFGLEDAAKLNQFAVENGLGRLSMWSANRDRKSSENSVGIQSVSNFYSGVKQNNQEFATILKQNMNGSVSSDAKRTTKSDVTDIDLNKPDDPKTSPYEIWNESTTYLKGTRVVWKHNVYRAKWWTKGDAPDAPILDENTIPWELVGPVLPGEKPLPKVSLPKGTYQEWEEGAVYGAGDRVMVNGIPYEAKWWNKDENPEKPLANDDAAPWEQLTQDEIKKVLKEIRK
ncbi:chitinase [Gottfriedia sp. NPDC058432]|uniref:chitinase n=1 Tax=unclassified Gottfriedia TaxID=2837516 RepID=UPI003660701A